jgi:sodium/bile acid cotransporter 7
MVCAVLAKRYAARPVEIVAGGPAPVWSDVSPED